MKNTAKKATGTDMSESQPITALMVVKTSENPATAETVEKRRLSADERLEKLAQFKALAERIDYLRSKQEDLNAFMLSNDGSKERLTLSNDARVSFDVHKSDVIAKVVDLLKEELSQRLAEAKNEVEEMEL